VNCLNGCKKVREGTVQSLRFFDTATFDTILKLNMSTLTVAEVSKFLTAFVEHQAERKMRSAAFLHNFLIIGEPNGH
jgi:hypothetical protein